MSLPINLKPTRAQLRLFSMAWLPLFLCVFAFFAVRDGAMTRAQILVAVAAVSVVLGAVAPMAMKPVFVGLVLVTYPIGFVVSRVITAAIYFIVLTPIGLVMRLGGYDPMRRHFARDAKTYWQPVTRKRTRESYFHPY